jgi:hypothetical protein
MTPVRAERRKREIAESIKRGVLKSEMRMKLPFKTEEGTKVQSSLIPQGLSPAQKQRREREQ